MTIESGGGLDSSRLFTGRALSLREQKFALDLEQARFDRTSTAKSPQEVCQPMNERKLDRGSRINAADEGTLGRPVVPNFFNIPNNGLVGKPVTPNAAARSAAFALRANVRNVRDIFLDGFVRPHCQDPRSIQPLLALLARNIR